MPAPRPAEMATNIASLLAAARPQQQAAQTDPYPGQTGSAQTDPYPGQTGAYQTDPIPSPIRSEAATGMAAGLLREIGLQMETQTPAAASGASSHTQTPRESPPDVASSIAAGLMGAAKSRGGSKDSQPEAPSPEGPGYRLEKLPQKPTPLGFGSSVPRFKEEKFKKVPIEPKAGKSPSASPSPSPSPPQARSPSLSPPQALSPEPSSVAPEGIMGSMVAGLIKAKTPSGGGNNK
jgi:hypothetical protein